MNKKVKDIQGDLAQLLYRFIIQPIFSPHKTEFAGGINALASKLIFDSSFFLFFQTDKLHATCRYLASKLGTQLSSEVAYKLTGFINKMHRCG